MADLRKIGRVADKAFLKQDKRGAHIGNLYTGKKVKASPFMAGGAVGALALFGTDMTSGTGSNDGVFGEKTGLLDIQRMTRARQGTLESGEAPTFLADGGSRVNNSLGASGDMVFGLHNRRKG